MTEENIYCEYKFQRWLFPLRYLPYNYYPKERKQATCCICVVPDNYYDCTICRVCNDGIICGDCFHAYEGTTYNYSIDDFWVPPCPLCRTLFIQNRKNNLIKYALLKHSVIPTSNNLYRRWIYNYMISDAYLFWCVDDDSGYTHRKRQIEVTKDIKRINVNNEIRKKIKKYNVKMAKKKLRYKLENAEWEINQEDQNKLEQLENKDKLEKLQNQYNPEMTSLFMLECDMFMEEYGKFINEYRNYDF